MKKILKVGLVVLVSVFIIVIVYETRTEGAKIESKVVVNGNEWDVTYSGWHAGYTFGNMQSVYLDVKELLATERYKDSDSVQFSMRTQSNGNVSVTAIKR